MWGSRRRSRRKRNRRRRWRKNRMRSRRRARSWHWPAGPGPIKSVKRKKGFNNILALCLIEMIAFCFNVHFL